MAAAIPSNSVTHIQPHEITQVLQRAVFHGFLPCMYIYPENVRLLNVHLMAGRGKCISGMTGTWKKGQEMAELERPRPGANPAGSSCALLPALFIETQMFLWNKKHEYRSLKIKFTIWVYLFSLPITKLKKIKFPWKPYREMKITENSLEKKNTLGNKSYSVSSAFNI